MNDKRDSIIKTTYPMGTQLPIKMEEEIFQHEFNGDTKITIGDIYWFTCSGIDKGKFANELRQLVTKYRI